MNQESQQATAQQTGFDYFRFLELVEVLFPLTYGVGGVGVLVNPDREQLMRWGKSVSSWLLTDASQRQATALLEHQQYGQLLQVVARRYSTSEAPEAAQGLFDYGKEYERRILIRDSLKTLFLIVEDFYKTHRPQPSVSSTIEVAADPPKMTQQTLPATLKKHTETDVKATSHKQIDVTEEDFWDIEFFD
ncbi:hypothetical protein [Idiomarina xiamenensis]|uniref:Uncharacterized protein n=1 Tax=Idiomarina xiamenensis 10-D-4 TaxID=740709 RepID=K2KCK4_9GAMM|nr:hypothetical protein [Idiomarina xiamenensis]EKE84397.1 hypothetical protein A10D4_04997 [Idiomarina xiamenensis 10-D-4]